LSATAKSRTLERYTLQSDGKQVARGINSIQAIKEAGVIGASYGHHGAGRVGHCAAAQGISP